MHYPGDHATDAHAGQVEMELIKFKKEHLDFFTEDRISESKKHDIENMKYSFSILHKGAVLCCGGILEFWPGRGEAWIIFSEEARKHMVGVVRLARKVLDDTPFKRIEATVDIGLECAEKWINLMGFKLEAPLMKSYGRLGEDCMLFSRVKE